MPRSLIEESARGFTASARTMATRCCWPQQPVGVGVGLVGEVEPAQQGERLLARLLLAHPVHSGGCQRDVVEHRHVREQVKAWKTMPIRRRTASVASRGSVISCPSSSITPSSTVSSRLMQRSSVDLPEPEAPMSTVAVCSGTSRLTPRRTSSSPKDLRTSLTRSTGGPVPWTGVMRCPARSAGERAHQHAVGEPRQRDGEQQEQDRGHHVRGVVERPRAVDLGRPDGVDRPEDRDRPVSLSSATKSLSSGGTTRRIACGRTTCRMVWPCESPPTNGRPHAGWGARRGCRRGTPRPRTRCT